jgi:hypothetical protein
MRHHREFRGPEFRGRTKQPPTHESFGDKSFGRVSGTDEATTNAKTVACGHGTGNVCLKGRKYQKIKHRRKSSPGFRLYQTFS